MNALPALRANAFYGMKHYFRSVEAEGLWRFEVALVRWPGPGSPVLEWRPYRRWKRSPDPARLQQARAAALRDPPYYRVCESCHKVRNLGHMHDRTICQSCAERHLGVCY